MSLPNHLKIGTRGSPLALWQAGRVAELIRQKSPATFTEIFTIATSGDLLKEVPLKDRGGKGLFVKEIEEHLATGRIDLAVHSVKDVPGQIPQGLQLTAVLERADPRDVLLSGVASSLKELPDRALVGTSSPRRMAQLKHLRPDLRFIEFRGNVQTRIHKMKSHQVDATVLAAAGLERLELTQHICQYFEVDHLIPAIGQGAIGIETRTSDSALNHWLQNFLNHSATWVCVQAERALLAAIHGDCHTPVAAYAQLRGDLLHMRACYADDAGHHLVHAQMDGAVGDAEHIGKSLAKELQCQF